MNKDRAVGAGREFLGDAEAGIGDAIGSARLQADGLADKVAGAFQHGYGSARDRISDAVDDAPAALSAVADRGRDLGRKADAYIRQELGDHGPLYVLAGAAALVGLGLFALAGSRGAPTPARKPRATAKPKAAARKPATARTNSKPRAKAPAR